MRECKKIQQRLVERAADDSSEVVTHLAECPTCRAFAEDLQAMRAAIRSFGSPSVPEDVSARVLDLCRQEIRQGAGRRAAATSAVRRGWRRLRRLDSTVPVTVVAVLAVLGVLLGALSPASSAAGKWIVPWSRGLLLAALVQNFMMLVMAPLLWRQRVGGVHTDGIRVFEGD